MSSDVLDCEVTVAEVLLWCDPACPPFIQATRVLRCFPFLSSQVEFQVDGLENVAELSRGLPLVIFT